MVKEYMRVYFLRYMKEEIKNTYGGGVEEFIAMDYPSLLQEVWTCALLNNFFWGVWSLALLKPEECT
jgi:hypothetical protein